MRKSNNKWIKVIILIFLIFNFKVLVVHGEDNTEKNSEISNVIVKMTNVGWNKVEEKWYYHKGNGDLERGWVYKESNWYFLNYDTGVMARGMINDGNSNYYLSSSGVMQTGWRVINGNWYYFEKSGIMARGWRSLNNKWYYLNNEGKMMMGWVNDKGTWYYLNSGGEMVTGWILQGGVWYYLGSSGAMATGWLSYNNSWYYLNTGGEMVTGWGNDKGTWYYLNSSGKMVTGWISEGGTWYYLRNSGEMATGWLSYNNSWYYLNAGGQMTTGWASDKGTWYYLNSSGKMITGWISEGGTWYYLRNSGEMATGWLSYNNSWYYLNAEGEMITGLNKIDKDWYLLESSGIMKTGWINLEGKWYYLRSDGKRATNEWITISGIKYWFNGQGIMADNEEVISGQTYYFNNDGRYTGKSNNKPYVFVEVLKTGDSDSIYIELPNGETALIDGGEPWNGDYVVNYLKTRNLRKEDGVLVIDYVINTHPHSDHIGGLIKVFENFKVNKFYYPYDIEMKRYEGFEGAESIENEGYKINCMNYCYQFYKRVLDLAVEKNVEIHDTIPASYIDPNNILKFVHPDKVYKQNYLDKAPEDIIGTDYDAFNSDSAVVMVDYYNFKMLITGDINKETEIDMVNLGLIPKDKINVLKVSHHGYNTSSSKELIDAIRPTFGVVTRSKIMENSPECKETNKLLRDYKVDLLETWRGNVKVYATDKAWNIEY